MLDAGRSSMLHRRCDTDLHRHPDTGIGNPDETASHRHCLPDVARDGDGDQIEAADAAVRRIERNPACAWHIDLRPGMCCPASLDPTMS